MKQKFRNNDQMNQPAQTPTEDIKRDALKHYAEASKAIGSYHSFIPQAIKAYQEPGERATVAPDKPIRKISLFLANLIEAGFWFLFFFIWYSLVDFETAAMVFMAMTIYKLSNKRLL